MTRRTLMKRIPASLHEEVRRRVNVAYVLRTYDGDRAVAAVIKALQPIHICPYHQSVVEALKHWGSPDDTLPCTCGDDD